MTSLQQEGSSQEGQVHSFEGLQVKAKSQGKNFGNNIQVLPVVYKRTFNLL